MIVMERNVFFACLIAIMISALVVPVSQTVAYEPSTDVKLTPFTISLRSENFKKFVVDTPILLLESGKSTRLHIGVDNKDVERFYDIQFYFNILNAPIIGDNVEISFVERKSVLLRPNAYEEVLLNIHAKSNLTETMETLVEVAAYDNTFGAVGKSFWLVVGTNITESDAKYTGLALREGMPGPAFPNLDRKTVIEEVEKKFGYRIPLPTYLPRNNEFRGLYFSENDSSLLYSSQEITNETYSYSFWNNGGMLIHYDKKPPYYNDVRVPWVASLNGQEVKVNNIRGVAMDQREQITIAGQHFKSQSVVYLFGEDFTTYLQAGFPLAELLKVASSLQIQNQEKLDDLKPMNNTLLIHFEGMVSCCPSLDVSPDGDIIAYSTTVGNDATDTYSSIWLYDIINKTSNEIARFNFSMIKDLSFSPDGNKLLFLSDPCDSPNSTRTLYIFSLSETRNLQCSELDNLVSADWMPDGSLLVLRFVGNETVGNRYRISAYDENNNEKLLYLEDDRDTLVYSARPNPSGEGIVLELQRPPDYVKFYVLNLEADTLKRVVNHGVQPTWSPNGRFLIYEEFLKPRFMEPDFGKTNPISVINIVDVDGIAKTTLVRLDNGTGFSDLALSPDGTQLIYAPYKVLYDEDKIEPLGIYSADLSKPIPEFPVNLMIIIGIGLMGASIALRVKCRELIIKA